MNASGGVVVDRLAARAAQAARVRALTGDPDVLALRVERVRSQVDGLLWAGIVLGLGFTMVNVQGFAAAGAAVFSPGWWVAWLLDPMVSLVLLAVLRAEQVTARYQVTLPAWARRTKWLTFAATYVMNTWTAWGLDGGPLSWSGVVLHSVPPLVVFATAETGPVLRDRLTEAVDEAVRRATILTDAAGAAGAAGAAPLAAVAGVAEGVSPDKVEAAQATVHDTTHDTVHDTVHGPVHESGSARGARTGAGGRRGRPPRRLLADYVRAASEALDRAQAAGERVEVSPAWARQVSGCSAGTSVKVAAALRAQTDQATPATSADLCSDLRRTLPASVEVSGSRVQPGVAEEVAA